jgi:hypothetical protein
MFPDYANDSFIEQSMEGVTPKRGINQSIIQVRGLSV